MYGWASLFGASAPKEPPTPEERAELENKRPHLYKCSCEVTWIANGLEVIPCWACESPTNPECLH